jgi:Rieske Fe-S protein
VGTPIGTAPPAGQAPPPTRPTVGAPVSTTGPVVGTPRPSVGTPIGSQTGTAPGAATARPQVATPARPTTTVAQPVVPAKPPESKAEVSRRNFIRALAVLGGVVAIGQFVALGPFLEGSVAGSTGYQKQVLQDASTGETLNTTSAKLSPENSWTTFVYPRTGNPNIDNDTFRQAVIIHLPKGWTAGQYGAQDPISGDTFVGLSRVCVHLWCLWSYVPTDFRGICPCHGSQYIPGAEAGAPNANQPGLAVEGPASLQTPPNNQLPVITLSIASDGTISATNIVGQIGCGQKC